MSNVIVELESLTKSFQEGDKTRVVLDAISGSFQRGEFVALLGRSGSGKSTLLNLISGIDQPTSGDVIIDGTTITQLSERERTLFRRDRLGFVFQFFNLIPTLTVIENITLPQELAGKSMKEAEVSAMRILETVGLADRRDAFPDKLSGGEQQRIAIARALAHDPELILADEPTGNLDADTGEKVLNMLLRLTRESGKSMIMATHSRQVAARADRIFRVVDGALVEGDNN